MSYQLGAMKCELCINSALAPREQARQQAQSERGEIVFRPALGRHNKARS